MDESWADVSAPAELEAASAAVVDACTTADFDWDEVGAVQPESDDEEWGHVQAIPVLSSPCAPAAVLNDISLSGAFAIVGRVGRPRGVPSMRAPVMDASIASGALAVGSHRLCHPIAAVVRASSLNVPAAVAGSLNVHRMQLLHANPIVAAFGNCIPIACASANLDDDLMAVGQHFVQSSFPHLVSASALAERLNISTKVIASSHSKLASGVLLYDRHLRSALESQSSRLAHTGQVRQMHYVDYVRFDGTRMKSRTTQAGTACSTLHESASASHEVVPHSLATPRVSNVSSSMELLQSEQTFGMLHKYDSTYVVVIGSTTSPVTSLERNTTRCIAHSQHLVSGVTLSSLGFETQTRASTLDKFSANWPAEQAVIHDRNQVPGSNFKALCLDCEVHIGCGAVHKHTFNAFMAPELSALIKFALICNEGGAMPLLQKCLLELVQPMVRIKKGVLTRAAMKYRSAMMSIFVATGSNLDFRRTLYELLPISDWRDTETIEIMVDMMPSPPQSLRTLAIMVCNGLMTAMLGTKLPLFVHGRWTGFELAVERQGIIHACHGLAEPLFLRFCKAHGDKVDAWLLRNRGRPCGLHPALVDGEAEWGHVQPGHHNDASQLYPPVGESEISRPHPDDGSADYAKFNAQNRRVVAEFHAARPLGIFMVMRTVAEPIRVMFEDYAWMQTDEWEREQHAKVISARRSGGDEILSRDYRVVVAAERRMELRFYETVRTAMLDKRLWESLPLENHTVAFRCKVYRMQARTGCLVA
jgi:hypothetical protein